MTFYILDAHLFFFVDQKKEQKLCYTRFFSGNQHLLFVYQKYEMGKSKYTHMLTSEKKRDKKQWPPVL